MHDEHLHDEHLHGEKPSATGDDWRPLFVKPGSIAEPTQWLEEASLPRASRICDTFRDQVRALIQGRHPRRALGEAELEHAFEEYCGGRPPEFSGVWVYYPWRRALVHLLDEADFVELRTSRNRYKITADEQRRLSGMAIGVVGLSVGAQVAVTMAMERVCGELRLADFDRLELSNLNRLREGVFSLGLPKVVLAARAISEIDPFIRVVCYPDGITKDNIDAFLTSDRPLDLLVEECDGLPVKLMCRDRARALGIPVLMEANDRATLDVERFDLEHGRPILHGLLDSVDLSNVDELKTNEDKVPIIMPLVGERTMSSKLRASLLEVGYSIEAWPQLASDVVLGGALVTNVARRIALGQFHDSGRYFVDLEELVGDEDSQNPELRGASSHGPEAAAPDLLDDVPLAAKPVMSGAGAGVVDLDEAMLEELVRAAQLAPSAANEQPWRWLARSSELWLLTEERFGGRAPGYREIAPYLALGAATENLVLRAHQLGFGVRIDGFPCAGYPNRVARFRFCRTEHGVEGLEAHVHDDLVESLEFRRTSRGRGDGTPIPPSAMARLRARLSSSRGTTAHVLATPDAIERAADILGRTERIRLLNPVLHQDLVEEIRWTEAEAAQTRDGLDLTTLELSPSEQAGLRLLRDPQVPKLLARWEGGSALEDLTRKAVASASALALLTAPSANPGVCFDAGRALERAWLEATRLGLGVHPHTAAVFLFAGASDPRSPFEARTSRELSGLREELGELFETSEVPLFLFRLFPGISDAKRSLRRDLRETLSCR